MTITTNEKVLEHVRRVRAQLRELRKWHANRVHKNLETKTLDESILLLEQLRDLLIRDYLHDEEASVPEARALKVSYGMIPDHFVMLEKAKSDDLLQSTHEDF